MANDKHTTVGQMQQLAEQVKQMDQENDEIQTQHESDTTVHVTATERSNWNEAYQNMHVHSKCSISIPASAWAVNTDGETVAAGYAYRADVAVSGLTANDIPETILDMGSIATARTAGVCPVAAAMAGSIRYYAVEVPEADISAVVRVHKAAS